MINKENIIVKKTFDFAIAIVVYSEKLESLKKYSLANQILKSGTSIGANINEAQNAESKADFIHKFKIAAKEAEETDYWLNLFQESKLLPNCEELLIQIDEIKKIIAKIIASTKNNIKNNNL